MAELLVLRRTPLRQAICQLLVDNSQHTWTVATFAEALGEGYARETVRATLYTLAHSGVLHTQADPTRLQFVLHPAGAERLRSIVAQWRGADHCPTPPPGGLWSTQLRPGGRYWQWTAPAHGCPEAPEPAVLPSSCQLCRESRFSLAARVHGMHAVMTAAGTLSFAKTSMLTEAIAGVLAGPVRRLVLDVTALSSVDDAGIHALKGLRRAAAMDRRILVVAHRQPRSSVAERLGAAGLLARHPVSPRPTRPAARATA